jgi:hypothetical protein
VSPPNRKNWQWRRFGLDCKQQSENHNLVLFYLKFGWESNTKKVEYILSFPMGIYLPSSDQRFRFYDYFHDDGFAENCNSGQIAVLKENFKFWGCSGGIPPLSWIPKSWTTLLAFRWLLIQPQRTNGLEDTEFCASAKQLKTELDSTTVGRNKIPKIKQIETPGLPNTIFIGSSLCFPMVHFITPNGQRITSYGY